MARITSGILDYLAAAILICGVLSYVFWSANEIFNVASLVAVVLYVIVAGPISVDDGIGRLPVALGFAFALVTLLNGLVNAASASQVLTQVAYAISVVFFLVFGHRFLNLHKSVTLMVSGGILLFGISIAVLGVFFDINTTDARQGFLGVPAMQGIAQNVNYNIVMSILSFCLFIASGRERSRAFYAATTAGVGLMLLMSGSRGALLGVLVAGSAAIIVWIWRPPGALIFALSLSILLMLFWVDWEYVLVDLNRGIAGTSTDFAALRLEKGLNNRDDIWNAAIAMFADRWLLGWGDISVVEDRLVNWYGAPTTAVQNGYMMVALRTGAVGLVLWSAIIVLTMMRYVDFTRRAGAFSRPALWVFIAAIFVLVDNMFRTYSPGGVGFIPTMMLVSLSYLLWLANPRRQRLLGHRTANVSSYILR